jgi:hypothetical protein
LHHNVVIWTLINAQKLSVRQSALHTHSSMHN